MCEDQFRAEFINRIDEIVLFKSLTEEDVRKVLKPMLDEICKNVQKNHNVTLQFDKEVERFLTEAGYSPQYGVRELRRIVERLIQIPLSELVLSGDLKRHSRWQAINRSDGITIIPIENEIQ